MIRWKLFSVATGVLLCTLILLVSLRSAVVAATPIFSDGFESGDLTAWTGSFGNPTVESSIVHSGAYAMECSSDTGQYVYEDLSSASTLYLRAYVYFSSLPTSGHFLSFSEMKHANDDNDIVAAVYDDSGTMKWSIRWFPWGAPPQAFASVGPDLNTWYSVELNCTMSGAAVNIELIVDGVSVLKTTDTSGSSDQFVYAQVGGWDMAESLTNYVDDVIVDNSYIGPATALVTFDQTGLNLDFTGTVITVDGINYGYNQLPVSFWWTAGSSHSFAYQSPLLVSANEKRYTWSSTSGTLLETLQSDSITAGSSGTVIGNYATQWYVAVISAHGSPSEASQWVNDGSSFSVSVTTPEVVVALQNQWVLTGLSVDGSPQTLSNTMSYSAVHGSHTIEFDWTEQWYLTVNSDYDTLGGAGWYDSGSLAYATLTDGIVPGTTGTQYVFTSWGGDASGTNYAQSDAITMSGPKTATAGWKTQYTLTMSANFGTTSPSVGDHWYDEGSPVLISAFATNSSGERFIWIGWTGSGTGGYYTGLSNDSNLVTMSGPVIETASWTHQFLTIQVKGSVPWLWGDGTVVTCTAKGDLYGDGKMEIVTGGYFMYAGHSYALLNVWDGSSLASLGAQPWIWGTDTVVNSVCVGDLYGDGKMEIVTGGYFTYLSQNIAQLNLWAMTWQ